MGFLKELFQKDMFRRIMTLVVLCFFLFLMKDMLNFLLLTFLFTFLMYSAQKFLQKLVERVFVVKIKKVVVTIALYLIVTTLLAIAVYKYVPIAFYQIVNILNEVLEWIKNQDGVSAANPVLNYIISFVKEIDITAFLQGKSTYLLQLAGDIGGLGLDIFLALVLSLFFILEKDRVVRFVSGFKESRIAGFVNELQYFGSRLINSFGKVIEAQILIAFCNGILSVIALWFLGFHQLVGLGAMIFFLGLVPVAGVFISLIPLSIIAFRLGGFTDVIYVVIMIVILHSLEAYILNPKLMSVKTNVPVFFTFMVLILSEHFMGIWGLIIGIPIFIFILDILEFKNIEKNEKEEKRKRLKKIDNIET